MQNILKHTISDTFVLMSATRMVDFQLISDMLRSSCRKVGNETRSATSELHVGLHSPGFTKRPLQHLSWLGVSRSGLMHTRPTQKDQVGAVMQYCIASISLSVPTIAEASRFEGLTPRVVKQQHQSVNSAGRASKDHFSLFLLQQYVMISRSSSASSRASEHQKCASKQSVVFILTDQSISLADNEHLNSLRERKCILDVDRCTSVDATIGGTLPVMTVPISRMPWKHSQSVELPERNRSPSPERSYSVNIRLDRIESHMKWKRFCGKVDSIEVYNNPISVY